MGYFRFTETSSTLYKCNRYHHYGDQCVGGSTPGEDSCKTHARGPLCRLCEEGFFHKSKDDGDPNGGDCVACDGAAVVVSATPVIVIGAVFLLGFFLLRYTDASSAVIRKCMQWVRRHWASFLWWLVSCRILFLQALVVTKFSYMQEVVWPPPFRYMVAFLDLLFLDLASWMPSTECAQMRHYQMLLFYTLAPVALYLGLRLAFFVEALRSLRGIERDGDFARTRATTLRHSSRKAYDLFLEILSALH